MNLKFQLRIFLETRRMTASELARLSDVPKQSISDWLGGSIPRDIQKLKRVADALRTTVDHLVFGNGTTFAPAPSGTSPEPVDSEWIPVQFEGRMRKVSGPIHT